MLQTKWKTSLTCYKTLCSLLTVPPAWQLVHLARGWKAAQPNHPACLKAVELENKACFNGLQEASSVSLVLAPQSSQQPHIPGLTAALVLCWHRRAGWGLRAAHRLQGPTVSPPSIHFPEFSIRPKLCLSTDPFLLLRLYPSLRKSHDNHWDLGEMMDLGTGNCR